MKRDFKTVITLLAFSLPVLAAVFIGTIYLANCGVGADCSQADLAGVIHTPIPTLPAATLPAPSLQAPGSAGTGSGQCSIAAGPLLAAWINSGYPESVPFDFTATDGTACQATFADVQPLFTQSDLWYPGALACAACHNPDVALASAHLDLSSYAGILAGGQRASAASKGEDILGGGRWDQSLLYRLLFVTKREPFGRPGGAVADQGPLLLAGSQVAAPTPAPGGTPTEEVEQPAQPSNGGGPGQAVDLTGDPANGQKLFVANCVPCHGDQGTGNVPNPGSNDGTVPALNPIDPTIASSDLHAFAINVDLFIQHGSTPEGPSPFRNMPAWGDANALSQQDIADLIAYIISLNK